MPLIQRVSLIAKGASVAALLFTLACTGSKSSNAEPVAGAKSEHPATELSKAYALQCEADLTEARSQLEKMQADTSSATVPKEQTISVYLEPFNALLMVIDRGMNRAALLGRVHPDGALREVADTCEQDFSKVVTDIGLSRPLYETISKVDASGQDEATQRYVTHLLRDFRRSGVDKDEPTRDKIRALKEELVLIGQSFGKNIREDVRSITLNSADDLKGLPGDYVASHQAGHEGKITISTDYPDYIPFMTYAQSDAIRLALYKEFRKRGHPANMEVLEEMLNKRHTLATLLGYENWAHYITEDKMIKTAGAAREFIEKISVLAKKRAKRDIDELLLRLQQDDKSITTVGDWQKSYVENLVKREKYNVDAQKVRQYFTYDKVREGLLANTAKMFGVEYRKVERPVWHESVQAYEIVDGGETLGRFYLDMHPRENKYKHAAAFPLITGVTDQTLPEAALVCNFPATGPMEHHQVETFFHEFGHLIHHLFGGKQRWVGVSGFNTEWDFVEAPSQMLEEWAWDAATLKTFASNEAGEVIPDVLISAMRKAQDFGKGTWVAHQMFYASVSLNYYDRDPAELDTTAVMKDLQNQYSPFGYVDDTYFQLSFGHLDGYSAIYYTYMWSLVIAKDLFSVFETEGMLNPEVAQRYRKYVLAPGGSRDAADMVHDFLGRDYTFDAFAGWLDRE